MESNPENPAPESLADQNVPAGPAGRPLVKIIGIGNAGISMLDGLNTPEFAGAELVAVNTDAASLAACPATIKIHLENKLLRGLGSGGDPDRGRALAEEQFSTLKSTCEGASVVFLLAGLGGGAGSGISPILARAAREAGALVLAFVTIPFACEGNRRETQARQSLEQLKAAADGVICLPGRKISRLYDDNTGAVEMFRLTSDFLVGGLRGVWQMITRPGLIQVHFSDLCSLVRDRHTESVFAFVEAAGAARSREVVEKLLAHPLLDEGRALADSDAVLVNLTAGKDLTMAEINRVMEQVKRQCGDAQIIMGAAVDEAMKNKLCVTLIASRQNPQAAPAATVRPEGRGTTTTISSHREAAAMRPVNRVRRPGSKMVQSQLPLTIISKGRFDKSEPTLHHGEDLDVPTFLRRGIALN
jgi:cell division protein FtsZ